MLWARVSNNKPVYTAVSDAENKNSETNSMKIRRPDTSELPATAE